MPRIRWYLWLVVMVAGFGLMWTGYRMGGTRGAWADAVLLVSEKPLPDGLAKRGSPAAVRLLPPNRQTADVTQMLEKADPKAATNYERDHREKIVSMPGLDRVFTTDQLVSGRMPKPGAQEVLAGPMVSQPERLVVDGRTFIVVGRLGDLAAPFWNAYVVPQNEDVAVLFGPGHPGVFRGVLLSRRQFGDFGKDDQSLLKSEGLSAIVSMARLPATAYYVYLAGMVLLLLGGCGTIIGGLMAWSEQATVGLIGSTLAEMRRYRSLLITVHVVYFGVMLAVAAAVYHVPDAQDALLVLTRQQIADRSSVLGVAGWAYGTRNIAIAAAVTLGINFLLGSLAWITAPSLVLPGVGALLALARAGLWGVLLAPSHPFLAAAMLPHSFTLLLEGEAYVLAAFFAILVPVFLFRPLHGATVPARWGRAAVVNLKGNLLVLAVLAVAALYEATEVILQMR